MSIGPIPRSRALAYAREHHVADFDSFWDIIRTLDAEQLRLAHLPKDEDPWRDRAKAADAEGMKRIMDNLVKQHAGRR